MKITYIHHSSSMADLEHTAFLFDYFGGDISEIPEDKSLSMSVSHRHGDHFSRSIFDLPDGRKKVIYVPSDDIWRRQVPEELLDRATFMGSGESGCLTDGARQPLEIEAFRSMDEGVAFLVKAEGQVIHHAKDLNNWVQEDEPEEDNQGMGENYHKELVRLAERHIDMAFILVDPRQEKDSYLGMDDLMRTVGAGVVFPTYFWGNLEATFRFKALSCVRSCGDKIHEIHKKGENFII